MPSATPGSVVAFADAPVAPLGPWTPPHPARAILGDPAAVLAAVALGIVALAALLAPWIAPFDPSLPLDLSARARPPSTTHWFGTDAISRDLLSRVMYGARLSLGISFIAVLVATLVGTGWGAVAGYAGGALDSTLMRIVDTGLAIPRIILLLAIVSLWGALTATGLALVLGLTGWFGASRLVRAEVRRVRQRDFTLAARALGAAPSRVLVRHVLPHAITPMLIAATLAIGQVVVVEAGLAFLGYGIAPPAASWGSIIRDGRDSVATAWWMSVFPGVTLALTVLAINVLGDRLRAALGGRQVPAP
ncbi:MAG TPA: ABC transporter permease [Gemmatimonadaceae bacterium]